MCGLVGFLKPGGFDDNIEAEVIQRMSSSLHNRGLDDHGMWYSSQDGIALGHQRLSILDLTSAGHQPMVSESGRYIIVFNGEIYNHRANLRVFHMMRQPGLAGDGARVLIR